jgi:hypothetical protein
MKRANEILDRRLNIEKKNLPRPHKKAICSVIHYTQSIVYKTLTYTTHRAQPSHVYSYIIYTQGY